jgi:hypothetical protein
MRKFVLILSVALLFATVVFAQKKKDENKEEEKAFVSSSLVGGLKISKYWSGMGKWSNCRFCSKSGQSERILRCRGQRTCLENHKQRNYLGTGIR